LSGSMGHLKGLRQDRLDDEDERGEQQRNGE
jgi:hypothetical protein